MTVTAEPRNPFVFVVGCPRSGTTLLQRMLDRHPQLAVANDVFFITRAIQRAAPHFGPVVLEHGDVELTTELIESVRTYHRLYRLQLDDEVVQEVADSSSTYRHFVGNLFARFAQQKGKALAGEKTPDYVRQLPFLHALFPWVKTVHLVRDGRDVSMSILDWAVRKGRGPAKLDLWQREPLATAALWWKWQVQAGMEAARSLPQDRYLEIRYEQLVAQPQTELDRILHFLGLLPTDGLITGPDKMAEEPRSSPEPSLRQADQAPRQGLRDWRSQMSREDQTLLDGLVGGFLEKIGYERKTHNASPEVAKRTTDCLLWWSDHLERRRRSESRWVGTPADETPADPLPGSG